MIQAACSDSSYKAWHFGGELKMEIQKREKETKTNGETGTYIHVYALNRQNYIHMCDYVVINMWTHLGYVWQMLLFYLFFHLIWLVALAVNTICPAHLLTVAHTHSITYLHVVCVCCCAKLSSNMVTCLPDHKCTTYHLISAATMWLREKNTERVLRL